jgi:hypothetical protein
MDDWGASGDIRRAHLEDSQGWERLGQGSARMSRLEPCGGKGCALLSVLGGADSGA